MSTPHINAKKCDFSDVILMPGDPLRAKYIANTFLKNSKIINEVRGMLGYTGFYKGKMISVMGHGMGIPSAMIYVQELITHFGIKKILRIGSCGAIKSNISIRDIIICMGASTDSKFNRIKFNNNDYSATADFYMMKNAINSAKNNNIPIKIGNIFSTDLFYFYNKKKIKFLKKYGILGIDMESSGIYSIASEFNASALTICTVSDHLLTGEKLSSKDRQNTFNDMIYLSLESLLLDKN
ncbi:purine-nucleoside phosphorylase [Sodalis-like secondary symbiont of Drepanosiphum platanoidis]|uniref:purine-nucleoside phosphorylase n=1 Tax=Sodalis-like secondary symbiont of Drepanosiphum platanoidis TaxID=2994493 RepID=UPI0034649AA6